LRKNSGPYFRIAVAGEKSRKKTCWKNTIKGEGSGREPGSKRGLAGENNGQRPLTVKGEKKHTGPANSRDLSFLRSRDKDLHRLVLQTE